MIRKADKNDSQVLAQMAIKVWNDNKVEDLKEEFDEFAIDKNMASFIKYVGDEPIGFANVALRFDYVEGCETSPVGYLEGIYVKKPYRLKGYAKELVEACQNWSSTMGCTEFASDCELTNTDSYNFHLAVEFVEANRIICFKKEI